MPEFQPQAQAVLDAVAQAGEEVVRQGQVRPETMAALTQDLAPADTLMRLSREFWSQGAAVSRVRVKYLGEGAKGRKPLPPPPNPHPQSHR